MNAVRNTRIGAAILLAAVAGACAGSCGASDRNTQQQTLDALFGGPAPRSEVEKNTVGRAGSSSPGIRSSVGDPQTNTVAKGELTRDILSAPQGDGREAQASTGS